MTIFERKENELIAGVPLASQAIVWVSPCSRFWTIGNDFSERRWQAGDRTPWRAKNIDTFKPMGTWIETDFDIAAAHTIVRVNGTEMIRFKTDHMIFGPAAFISQMS